MFARLRLLREAYRKNAWLKRELAKERAFRQRLGTEGALQEGEGPEGLRAENVIWIFGTGRTGSTWLSRMIGELKGHYVWNEPLVGALFGNLYYNRARHRLGGDGEHYILGDAYRESWLDSIRAFVLKEATGRFPEAAGPSNYLVIKEPNGSIGAPLLMEALPESCMILLVRDPRDVVASSTDAMRKGGWNKRKRQKNADGGDPTALARKQAQMYRRAIEKAKQAYEAHEGRKVLVRYEELRDEPLETVRRIYSALEIEVDHQRLAQAVEKHSWERIPEEEKGEGKFYRKAMPGGWREDLTPEQARVVEEETRPLLEEYYGYR